MECQPQGGIFMIISVHAKELLVQLKLAVYVLCHILTLGNAASGIAKKT